MTTAIKRYTMTINRAFAYSIFYVCMNIGALLAPPFVDLVHRLWPHHLEIRYASHVKVALSAHRGVFAITGIANFVMILLTAMLIRRKLAVSDMHRLSIMDDEEQMATEDEPTSRGRVCRSLGEVLRSRAFWGFFGLMLLLTGIKSV